MNDEKLSDILYYVNANLSALTFIKRKTITLEQQRELNRILGEVIKKLRIYEENDSDK